MQKQKKDTFKKKENIRVDCVCGGSHYLEINKWEEDSWVCMINADNYPPWYERVKEAIRYVFGDRIITYHDVVMDDKQWKAIKKFFS